MHVNMSMRGIELVVCEGIRRLVMLVMIRRTKKSSICEDIMIGYGISVL